MYILIINVYLLTSDWAFPQAFHISSIVALSSKGCSTPRHLSVMWYCSGSPTDLPWKLKKKTFTGHYEVYDFYYNITLTNFVQKYIFWTHFLLEIVLNYISISHPRVDTSENWVPQPSNHRNLISASYENQGVWNSITDLWVTFLIQKFDTPFPTLPGPKEVQMSKSKIKWKLFGFLDRRRISRKEFVHLGERVDQFFYEDLLEGFYKSDLRVWSGI